MSLEVEQLAALAALAAGRGRLELEQLVANLRAADLAPEGIAVALERMAAADLIRLGGTHVDISPAGSLVLVESCAALERALDNSPSSAGQEDCPSIPWLTTVQTEWIDAISINYAVEPDRLSAVLPAPLQPEIFKGTAWVQLLMSSLRDMRPQGLGSLFGVNFYQVSYRAAVTYRNAEGDLRRGGYFVRSDTNHAVMRAVGNTLVEFKFHEFGAADMLMVRDGEQLTVGIDAEVPSGRLIGVFDTRPTEPPPDSVWSSLAELQRPLVECYDAYGVDADAGYLYTLTIDRDPWNARFVEPLELYSEYFDTGPLGDGAARLDSVLHIPRCAYRWRPLRRERFR